MPSKIRKKSETGGLGQPDQVMTTLQTTYSTLDKFKYHIVGAFFGTVVILLAVSWYVGFKSSQKQELAQSFFEAFRYHEAPVGEEAAPAPGLPVFKTSEEKYTKLSQELEKFLTENENRDIGDTARLVLASAQMELGKFEEAYGNLKKFVENVPDSALVPIIYENLGYASLRLGRIEEAEKHFVTMRDATPNPYLKARGLIHLGDMYNPAVFGVESAKDAEKARSFYGQAKELLPEEVKDEQEDPANAITRQDLEVRLSLLNLG